MVMDVASETDENSKPDVIENRNTNTKATQSNRDNFVSFPNITIVLCSIVAVVATCMKLLNRYDCNKSVGEIPQYWVYSASSDVENENGLLKHVHLVLKRAGYEKSTNETPWKLLWSHDYPFRALYPSLHKLKSNQLVNHFPGTGYITNKVNLATSNLKFVPKAFKLPDEKDQFLEYTKRNVDSMFLEKHNQHRGVFLKNVSDINLEGGDTFVQEYVQKPFLVDGYKFDIGVYVVLTSVNPLRVYWYKGDVLFRYCTEKYYPLDPKQLEKYVIGDDYLPTWEVPSLAYPYRKVGLGMKDSFDVYLKMQGYYPNDIWEKIQEAIAEVFINKEHHIIEALKYYPSSTNFFELMRFDLVLDEDLNVYLLEANMSPNLSSAHYPPNQLLYEQLLYNLFSLTGVFTYLRGNITDSDRQASKRMISSMKNIAVWGEKCSSVCRLGCSEVHPVCATCSHCLEEGVKASLMRAHHEHLHKGDFRRLYPPKMEPKDDIEQLNQAEGTTDVNKIQNIWYQGKCNIDTTWC